MSKIFHESTSPFMINRIDQSWHNIASIEGKQIIMTTINSELIEVLNDLIKINNDRITGYEKAAEESKGKDTDHHLFFHKLADESRRYIAELTGQINWLGGESETGSTTMGKIYRTWMDVKAAVTGNDRTSILSSCEYGEDQAQKAYEEALASDADIDIATRKLITTQKEALLKSHNLVKQYRDISK